jgi:hypothetical protein
VGKPVCRSRMIRPLLLAAVMLLTPPTARAHDWFTGKVNPASPGQTCCGGGDCKEVPDAMLVAGVVQEVQGGYLVQLTPDQIKFFAPGDDYPQPIHQIVPWAQVQPSETMSFALCVVWDKVRCFFAPQTS